MANPFLMNDDDVSPKADAASNPFLMQESQDTGDDFANDNPFLAQANNPFAAFGDADDNMAPISIADDLSFYPTTTTTMAESTNINVFNDIHESEVPGDTTSSATNNIDSAMSFFGTTITDMDDGEESNIIKPIALNIKKDILSHYDDNMAYSSEDELTKDKLYGPPARPVPPSKTTQDLILSVSDQLDQTSSHLLGRIPATRTPSPVSMRDLHSPSPTPDFGDLLDVSDVPNNDFINQIDDSSVGHTDFMDMSSAQVNDNPFMTPEPAPVKMEPPRPPPPRPTPPRPNPPRRPSPPQVPVAPVVAAAAQAVHHPPPRPAPIQHEPDLFDMFGSDIPTKPTKPPPPKSNQDILNLFAAPSTSAAPAPISNTDLLSGDILSMDDDPSMSDLPIMSSAGLNQTLTQPPVVNALPVQIIDEPVITSIAPAFPTDEPQASDASDPEAIDHSSVSPVVSDIPTPAQLTPHTEKENILDEIEASEHSEHVDSASLSEHTANIAAPPSDISDEQMDTTVDFGGITPTPSVNPFASPESEMVLDLQPMVSEPVPIREPIVEQLQSDVMDIFGGNLSVVPPKPVAIREPIVQQSQPDVMDIFSGTISVNPPAVPRREQRSDEFDAFAAKFDSVKKEEPSLLGDGFGVPSRSVSAEFAWGDGEVVKEEIGKTADGFGNDEGFDSFLAMGPPPPPQRTYVDRNDSHDSDEHTTELHVIIRPKESDMSLGLATPILAPPPKGSQNNSIYSGDSSPRFNPFDKGEEVATSVEDIPSIPTLSEIPPMERTDSQETPPTPLFDDDVSQPLEDFPRVSYEGDGWELQLRQPNKKKITGQRFWKKIWLKIVYQGDNPVLQLKNSATDKEPFQELPLQACYSVSEITAQQFDNFGKIFTLKLQYIFYKERPGLRPGQVTKAERLTNKLSQFAAYAIQGDYQGVKEFGSDLKKLGLPVEHAPTVTQLFKIGSHNYEDLKQFSVTIEELLFKFHAHRDRAMTYKMEEVQLTAVDELYVEQDAEGRIVKQIARVRLHFLGFLSGMPTIELGVNDLWRQGKEVVGRHDIIPVVTEEWIRLEGVEFHSSVQQNEYERSRTIRFQPPDGAYIELMRFRVRPPKNRELPFQLKAVWCVTGNKVELRADVLVPGFASRKLGQIPCEDVAIRFPIPECWIYLFRVEKHFRYGSVKSAHRRTGKIKGIDRFLGTMEHLQESLIEVTSGQAKYEHHHRAIVWRCPRLPKDGQGAYTTHQLVVRMALTSFDQIPEQLAPYCYVEFTMPATQVSHVTVRSVSVQDSESDDPPEKYVRYLARHEYKVGIEHTTGESLNPYLAATVSKPAPVKVEPATPAASLPIIAGSDSDSDSN